MRGATAGWRDFLELTKPRIVALVLVTVAVAFALGAPEPLPLTLLAHTLFGTALVAAGTNALNQVLEGEVDGRMRRTRHRPIPAGRLGVAPAAVFASASGLGGAAYLALVVNPLAGALAALTLVSYAFVYTPLKRTSSLATLVGAVPGALPVVGGWVAGSGTFRLEAGVLFAILFLWQLPHFLALAWLYREDYAAAGLRMLSVDDPDGRITFRQAGLASLALLSAAMVPSLIGMTGLVYFWGGLLLSLWLVWSSIAAAVTPSSARARRLFRVSVAYLPALLTLMLIDRLP
jgi:protoheme IX farnesyltransferase